MVDLSNPINASFNTKNSWSIVSNASCKNVEEMSGLKLKDLTLTLTNRTTMKPL